MPTLEFGGKQLVYAHHLGVSPRPLQADAKKSLAPKGGKPSLDDNLIIHGDNLHALKALLPRYGGRVNCIYIDPPYNTGNEGWAYNDNVSSPMMKAWLKDKNPVDGEDLERHDKWLCMMWPRLQLLRELLAEDGVIFISIDDNEQHRLRMMMDEIFGEENFQGHIHWRRRHNQPNDKTKMIGLVAEHVLSYSKDWSILRQRGVGKISLTGTFANPDNDPRGDWASKPWKSGSGQSGTRYKITAPDGKVLDEEWMGERSTYDDLVADNRIFYPNNGRGYPRKRYFRVEREEEGQCATNWWSHKHFGDNQEASVEMAALMGTKNVFDNPKPTKLIKNLINISDNVADKKDMLILDSFAGSGTTAHAVLALNKEDGGKRKFILVECEDYADKITAERVRRVIKGVPKAKDENLKNGLGGSFTYCTLGDEISIEKMLSGKKLPDYETLAGHLVYTTTGQSPDKIRKARGKDGFFCESAETMFYLIYEPNRKFLLSAESALNSTRAERIAKQAKTKNKQAVVFATHKFIGQKELTAMGIVFCGLPYVISG